MSEVRVHNFSVALDGFAAGEDQQLQAPFGHAGTRLVEWAFETRTFRGMGIHGRGCGFHGRRRRLRPRLVDRCRGRDHGPQQVRATAGAVAR